MTCLDDERSARPPDYCGRILNGSHSDQLKRRVIECCNRYHAFEETGTPVIPYIAAWHQESDTIWYEYASQRLADLLDCQVIDVAEVLRNSVVDRRIYRSMDAEAGISKEIQSREELSVAWRELRTEGQTTGVIEAVYKIALRRGTTVWLKDQAIIETLEADRICLSPGLLTNVTKEMEAEDELEKHRDQLEAVVQARTAELTRLNEQLKKDIVERNRAEVALRQSEEKYRDIVENSVEGILRSAPDGTILSVNPALTRMFGFESPEQVVREVHEIGAHLYQHPGEWLRLLARLRNENQVVGYEAGMRRRNGDQFWISVNIRCVRSQNGGVAFYDAFVTDITERKQMEQEKERLEAQLRQAQKMEAIGTLAGGVAHDFNNILAIIMTNVELAELKLEPDAPARENLAVVLKAAHRARDLVKQILTFSRASEQRPKPLHVIPLIKQVMELFRAALPTSIEIRQQIEVAGGEDLILADATQIHQLLMNHVTNAAHAMRERGGVLTVTLSNVDSGSEDDGVLEGPHSQKYLKLTVKDTGHGMDRATMERIFDPYFTTKSPGEGTGLGLAVVHGIVKSHGGAIEVYSEPGKGSAFHVFLPRLDRGDASERTTYSSIPTGSERILLVDDEEELVKAGRQMLEHLGYQVCAGTSSSQALDLFRQQPQQFDLVITDYTMPGMTGVDLARELMKIRPGIPIILVTGFNERVTEDRAREMGIRAFMMKAFTIRDFAVLVRAVLDKT